MKKRAILSVIVGGLCLVSALPSLCATLTVNPPMIGNQFRGMISFQVGGLTNGEAVFIDQFADYNTNGAVDPDDMLMARSRVADGGVQMFGGVTNINVPFDLDPTPGAITASVGVYRPWFTHTVGHSIFRLSSPWTNFEPVIVSFEVTNAAPQRIQGTIRSGTNAVPYASVILLGPPDRNYCGGTVADASGNYVLAALPGNYMLMAQKSGYVYDSSSAPQVTLTAGGTTTADLQLTPATCTITGTVRDAGNPSKLLGGLFVMAESTNNWFAYGSSDVNGVFTLPVIPSQWKLDVQEEQTATRGYLNPEGEAKPRVNVTSGTVSTNIDLPKATALLYGTLKTTSNTPLAGVAIGTDSSFPYSGSGFTGTNGYFCVGVTATNWNVGPSSEDLMVLGYIGNGTNVTIGTNQATGLTFTATPLTASLSGRVIDSDTNGVSRIGVHARQNNGPGIDGSTDDNGYFNLGVCAGTWQLAVAPEDAAQRGSIGSQLEFTVSDGTNISNIVLTVRQATAQVSGWVQGNGTGVAWVNVGATATVDGTSYNVGGQTDGTGNYSLPAFIGSWELSLDPSRLNQLGFVAPAPQTLVVSNSAQTFNFTLEPLQPLQVTTASNLTSGRVGESYVYTLFASGGQLPYNWSPQGGTPPGLVLQPNGELEGTPTVSGTFDFSARVNDWLGANTNRTFSIYIAPAQPSSFSFYHQTANGEFEMSLSGIPGHRYEFQTSTTLTNWFPLQTLVANTNTGALYFKDTNSPSLPFQFYRAVSVP